ncbi:MAG TPA: ABC transporter ATP-binding protein [Anaerolineales bacterium]|nr:ABC transporter ATP-binding protein [Anaerolineales bacterium]
MPAVPFVELKNISKYFAKVIANQDVSMQIRRGEVLALLGENGAGKSTIMKVLYGLYKADTGQILVDGQEKVINSPRDAMALGIAMIQQHFSLVQAHTVTENIILGNVQGRYDLQKYDRVIRDLASRYGFELEPSALISDLPVGVQQKVEILKALYQNAQLLIMDEPTAVLTPQESDVLMKFVRENTREGKAVVFITHKLREVMEVADHIVVMRNGRVVGDLRKDETNELELSKLMVGKEIHERTYIEDFDYEKSPVGLELQNVTIRESREDVARIKDINFQVHKGEILGIAGVSGNGQDALCDAITGYRELDGGRILLNEKDISAQSVRERIQLGISYVPSDRQRYGLIMALKLAENMLLKSSFEDRWVRRGLIDQKALDAYTKEKIQDYQVKATGPDQVVRNLSGGNQQKVILAREVDLGREVIVFDQPTRGLDLGAIDHIQHTILAEKKKGKAILLISTELTEIFALSDRIAVIYKGEIVGIYRNRDLDTEQIGLLMAGYAPEREQPHEP